VRRVKILKIEIMFLESEIDAGLKLMIKRWPEIPFELSKAIVKMVK